MPKHAPSTVWALTGADLNEYVRTDDDEHLLIVGHGGSDGDLGYVVLTRRRARLLAKRITECLEATK